MRNKRLGLTPQQIKQAIHGSPVKQEIHKLTHEIKKIKPAKSVRVLQNGDNGLLLNMPFTSTRTAFQYDAPDWFTSTQKSDVSVIVPIYNTSANKLISSWDLNCDGLKVELIFVDDHCPNNSKESVLKEWEKRRHELKGLVGKIFYSTDQQGWGACCNIGAEKASGEIVIFLHPETLLTQGWLKPLVQSIRKEGVGIVSALQIDVNERNIVDAGSEWSWGDEKFLNIGVDVYRGKQISKPFKLNNIPLDLSGECEKVSSNCMAMMRNTFRFYGGFSQNLLSSAWGDADLCMFVKEHGLKIIQQCNTQVFRQSEVIKYDKDYESGRINFCNKWITSGRIDSLVVAKRKIKRKEIETIVIRRRAAHGDVLIAASVVPALKKKYPAAKIVFSTDCPEVLQDNPWIDQVVEVHSERWFQLYYDLDMVYEYRPEANIMLAFADAVGVDVKDCDLFLPIAPLDVELPDKYAVIHAGKTLWAGRNWTTLKFDSISNKLKAAGYKVVCVGTWSDHKTTTCDLDLRDKTSIPQLATVILNSKIFVGIDSFPMHVAQTFEVPGVCFFGSIRPETRLFNNCMKPVVADGIKCLGCHHKKPTPCTSTPTCDVGIQDCVNGVSSENMWRIIVTII